mgnify:CR=1 FL=1
MQSVLDHLNANREQAVEQLKALLRIPTVSADSRFKDDVRRGAEFVRDALAAAGLKAELCPTPGNAIVYAEWLGAGSSAPTVLIYGHYDVQPPDPLDKWTTPAFEPTVRDGAIYARGATDDKGQVWTHVLSVAAWLKAAGKLPVNVKFVIEGEEEVGSRNLDDFLATNKGKLKCDIVVVSDTSQYGPGMPAITYGLRGILACEVTLTGPNRDLHSGVFGGSVWNPINALCRLIGKLHDDEGRITVPGFYDDVSPLTDAERQQFRALPFDEHKYQQKLGVDAVHGEAGFSTLERRWARPTCDVNGIYGGYTGEGPKTIVPSTATAKITCRLVPNQNPDKLTQALESFLQANTPAGTKLKFMAHHGGWPTVADLNSPFIAAARRAIEQAFGTAPVMIREGGSIPVVATFKLILGVDTLLLGWGQDTDNLHSPDEHFSLADFHKGTLASAVLWKELAK